MRSIRIRHLQMLDAVRLCVVLALASCVSYVQAEDASVEALRMGIEGVYVLQEWHRNGEIVRPPLVDARTVLLNGRIIFISHDQAQDANRTTVAGYGTYLLEPGKFSYSYERFSTVTQQATETSVSEKLPWEGPRTFRASIENKEVLFRATNGPQEFRFTTDGLSYSDGKLTRKYRRVTEN
jgi:hypothetical protein